MNRTNRPPWLIAVVGPTATGKSALALRLADMMGGEIISCDSTAVYRGFDIGTDKVLSGEQRGIAHHLVDIVEPTDVYSAARYSRDAARVVREITKRGRLPILVGGTGLYYRALTRGLFPGPERDPALRARLSRMVHRRGNAVLCRLLRRHDPESARRIQPGDVKRLIRAVEVFWLTGRALSEHFAETRSLIADYRVLTVGLRLPMDLLETRIAKRVDTQLEAGLLAEVSGLLASGVPEEAGPFGGLVYRQVLQHLRGKRDLASTRELIVRENRKYARRQLLWFRREPHVHWFESAGERSETAVDVQRLCETAMAGANGEPSGVGLSGSGAE